MYYKTFHYIRKFVNIYECENFNQDFFLNFNFDSLEKKKKIENFKNFEFEFCESKGQILTYFYLLLDNIVKF